MLQFIVFAGIADNGTVNLKFSHHQMLQETNFVYLVINLKELNKVNNVQPGGDTMICTSGHLCQYSKAIRRHDHVSDKTWDVFSINELLPRWKHNSNLLSIELMIHFVSSEHIYSMTGAEKPLLLLANSDEDSDIYQYFGLQPTEDSRKRRYAPIKTDENEITRDSGLCQVYPWKLSFESLDWDWVIAPKEYSANFCKGSCPEPLPRNMKATNHAIVKAIYRSKLTNETEFNDLPPACCVPVKLNPMSMLYNYEGLPYVRRLNEMSAEYCACV